MRFTFNGGSRGSVLRVRTATTVVLLVAVCLTVPRTSHAQTSPGDLMDLSLAELLQREIPSTDDQGDSESWHFDYRYVQGQFGGYRDQSSPVANADLLGPPNNTTYPILQTRIVQEAHLFRAAFNMSPGLSANIVVPYIRQSTDHISVVPGYKDFTIVSEGVGDVSLTLTGIVHQGARDSFMMHGGISVPTGSITETGNTPAGPGSQLPYTMQIGSGTWDVPIGVNYRRDTGGGAGLGPVRYRLSATGKVRTGENVRGYRLGHRLVLDGSASMRPLRWLSPSIGASSEVWGDIKGHDLNFPGPVYPTPVANPELFGGRRVSATFGLAVGANAGDLGQHSLDLNFSLPFYQDLHGPQPEENWRGNISWNSSF
jgi:hypothetical protein